jgi:methylthioribose-1-phosphate isomerase
MERCMMRTIELKGRQVVLIDQTRLPHELKFVRCRSAEEIARAIEGMKIRGAPALGVAAAMALAITALRSDAKTSRGLISDLRRAARRIRMTRPTAVNLFWSLERILARVSSAQVSAKQIRRLVVEEAQKIAEEDIKVNRLIGENGASLIKDGDVVLTHCNAGWLATAGEYGTALGAIKVAWEQGKRIEVIATETRPLLQGARLTAWELKREGVPFTLITDGMVGTVMRQGMVSMVMVGADRIASNGDVANKIGTYTIAVLAKEHGIPFYCVAPTSSIDLKVSRGEDIPIEYRAQDEVTTVAGRRIAPKGTRALNPAFDVTPARMITAIVTEKGVVKPGEVASLFK